MSGFRLIPLLLLPTAAVAAACAVPQSASAPPPATAEGFRSGDCNLVSDADVNTAAGAGRFDKVVVGDAGCFWQEKSMIGSFGAGMGISTWWYRGSDLDAERTLERKAGREITEVSIDGNTGFRASDDNACSIYVAKGGDVITWSIQTVNPGSLPPLCAVVGNLAQLSQDRVN